MQWMGLMMIFCGMTVKDVRSGCEEDKGTDCKNGDNDTDWYRHIRSDMHCVLTEQN